MGKRKQPTFAEILATEKHPRIGVSISDDSKRQPYAEDAGYSDDKPSWRISKLEMVDPFGWHTLTRDDASHVLQKLTDFESMTWREILFGSKKQHHSVTIDQICKEARERLEAIGLGDVESIISLRLSGQERIWGLRLDSTLLILWWDPTHQVCPSPKKYT